MPALSQMKKGAHKLTTDEELPEYSADLRGLETGKILNRIELN